MRTQIAFEQLVPAAIRGRFHRPGGGGAVLKAPGLETLLIGGFRLAERPRLPAVTLLFKSGLGSARASVFRAVIGRSG